MTPPNRTRPFTSAEAEGYFALRPEASPLAWQLTVAPWRSVGGADGFLFGGLGLGACVAAAERSLGRATVWASAQYLGFAPRGELLRIEVLPLVEGRTSAQVRAIGRVGTRDVIHTALSLGARHENARRQWVLPPRVPPPADCPRWPIAWKTTPDDLFSRLDVRVARFPSTTEGWDGHAAVWMRPLGDESVDRPMLALMADFVPALLGTALAEGDGHIIANSLDNCIRFLSLAPTEWVLCDLALSGVAEGFGHGRMHLFAENGALLATASQSVIVRGRINGAG